MVQWLLPGQDSNRYLQPGEGDVALIVGAKAG